MEALKLKGWVDTDGHLHIRDAIALPIGQVELVVWQIPQSTPLSIKNDGVSGLQIFSLTNKQLPVLLNRVNKVKKMRLSSTKQSTVRWADFPTLFTENRQPNTNYVLIPRVSSENRKYIPIGFFNGNAIASDTCITIPNGDS